MLKNGEHQRPIMLICYSLATGGYGGAERVVITLARQLEARGLNIKTVFPLTPHSRAALERYLAEGVKAEVHSAIPAPGVPRRLRQVAQFPLFLRQQRPRAVNLHYGSHWLSFKDVLGVRLAGVKRCLVSVHHVAQIEDEHTQRMTRLGARLATTIIVHTPAGKDFLEEIGVQSRKIRVVPLGLRPPTKTPSKSEARARLNLPAEAFVISTLARLVPYKGIDDLIEATACLLHEGAPVLLLVGGAGPARPALEALATQRLGNSVRFLGAVPETDDLYAAADIFALPSREEGFGLVYVEAAFHGIPSIGLAVGGVPYVIEDGKTGLLAPSGNVSALSLAIRRLYVDEELRKQLGNAARARSMQHFTEEVMGKRYADLLLSDT